MKLKTEEVETIVASRYFLKLEVAALQALEVESPDDGLLEVLDDINHLRRRMSNECAVCGDHYVWPDDIHSMCPKCFEQGSDEEGSQTSE